MNSRIVWMHAATRGCGYPVDSSDLAAGAAGAATSLPILLWRRSDRGLRLTPSPIPAGDPDNACLLYATHSTLAGPRGLLPSVGSGERWRSILAPGPWLTHLFAGLQGRRRRPQCRPRANCVGLRLPPVHDSLLPSSGRGAGHPESLSAGSGKLWRLRLPPTLILPVCHRSKGAGGQPCQQRANCDSCAYLRTATHSLLAGPRAAGPGTHSAGSGQLWRLFLPPTRILPCVTGLRGPGTNSVGQGVSRATGPGAHDYDGCAYPRPVHPYTRAASAPRSQWAGRLGGLLDWSRPAPRRLGRVRAPGAEYS